LGLRWRDVDWTRATLSVQQQVVIRHGAPAISEPKSRAARRTIEVDPVTLEYLEGHHEKQAHIRKEARYWQSMDLVFCTSLGTPINPANLYRQFAPIVKEAGVYAGLSIHDCRHSHATHLIMAGVPITEVSRRLGHSKVSITVDVYGHLLSDRESRVTSSIQEMLFPSPFIGKPPPELP
jgi:integrase